MKTFEIRDYEAGNVIERNLYFEQAKRIVAEFEKQDKIDGTYTPGFYEIVEVPNDIDRKYAVFHSKRKSGEALGKEELKYLGLGTIREMEGKLKGIIMFAYQDEEGGDFEDCDGILRGAIGGGVYSLDKYCFESIYCTRVTELSQREYEAVNRAGGYDAVNFADFSL